MAILTAPWQFPSVSPFPLRDGCSTDVRVHRVDSDGECRVVPVEVLLVLQNVVAATTTLGVANAHDSEHNERDD